MERSWDEDTRKYAESCGHNEWKDKVFAQVIGRLLRSPATDPTMSAQTAIIDEAYLEPANYHLGPPVLSSEAYDDDDSSSEAFDGDDQ